MTTKKAIIILIITLSLTAFTLVMVIYARRGKQNPPPELKSSSGFNLQPYWSIPPLPSTPPSFTGAKFEPPKSPKEKTTEDAAIEELSTLRDKLPLKTDSFFLDFDYATNSFLVTLESPNAKTTFLDWLKIQGYSHIPPEKFHYQ